MTLDELERCIGILLNVARSRGVRKLDTGAHDYYWNVPAPEWVDMTKAPNLTVGSLDDDLSEIQQLLQEPERASSVDLDRVAAMLRLLSAQLSGEGAPPRKP